MVSFPTSRKAPRPCPRNEPYRSPTRIWARLYRKTWRPRYTQASLNPGRCARISRTSSEADPPARRTISEARPPKCALRAPPSSFSSLALSRSWGRGLGHDSHPLSSGPVTLARDSEETHVPPVRRTDSFSPPATCSYSSSPSGQKQKLIASTANRYWHLVSSSKWASWLGSRWSVSSHLLRSSDRTESSRSFPSRTRLEIAARLILTRSATSATSAVVRRTASSGPSIVVAIGLCRVRVPRCFTIMSKKSVSCVHSKIRD